MLGEDRTQQGSGKIQWTVKFVKTVTVGRITAGFEFRGWEALGGKRL